MKRTTKLSYYIILFIIFGLIGLWMPLLGDDLHWGTYFGSNYFPQKIFLYYDGRYLGDILVIAITKIRPLAFMAYGLFMTTMVYLIQRIREQISQPKGLGLLSSSLATIFIFIVPKFIFKQILGWHAGFANYAPSVIFPLFMLYLVLRNYDNKDVHYYRTSTVLIFLAAIGAQFFAEHITLLNVFNSILVWLFFRKHFGEHFKRVLNWIVAGNFIGAFLMFINGAYIKILFGRDGYRSLKGSQNSDTMFHYFRTVFTSKQLLFYGAIVLLLTILIAILTYRAKNIKQKIANFALLLSAFVVIAPFIVVSPFGSRCIFASYMFFATIISINLDLWLSAYEKFVLPVLIVISMALGLRMDAISHNYRKTFNMQIDYSLYQNTVNRDTQYFLQYKNTDYIWLTANIQDDQNFSSLYVKDNNRNKVPINYYDWTDALNKIKNKHFKTRNDYWHAFDQQILKKVKLINDKNN